MILCYSNCQQTKNPMHTYTISMADVSAMDQELFEALDGKHLIWVYHPGFELITNCKVSGQHEISDGKSTGQFTTINTLSVGRQRGEQLYIPLGEVHHNGEVIGYYADYLHKANLGEKVDLYLDDLQAAHLGMFVYMLNDPTPGYIRGLCP